MLSREMDIDEHIQNISAYRLSFFQKLALCRGLQFAFPTRINEKEVLTSFERTYRACIRTKSGRREKEVNLPLHSALLH